MGVGVTSVNRNRKLLAAARDQACQWCFRQDGTVVAAHANELRYGKGMGIKAHDWAIAFLCSVCHQELDQGSWMTRDQRRLLWDTAHQRTRNILREKGLLEADDQGAGKAGAEGTPQVWTGSHVHSQVDPGLRVEDCGISGGFDAGGGCSSGGE